MSNLVLETFVGSMTVAELCARTGCTVEALVDRCTRAAKSTSEKPSEPAKGKEGRSKSSHVSTRNANGRKAFDAELLAVLREADRGLSGREIEQRTGASLPQIRAAIARLGKRVRSSGKTVARRYSA